MTDQYPRILYITGWMRSGSTLVGNVLNELPGVLHAGELHYLWENGLLASGTNSVCGCGDHLTGCPLWSAVLDSLPGGVTAADAHRMVMRQHALLRTRHTRTRLAEALGRTAPAPGVADVLDRTADIYHALRSRGGERLIVDGSKFPAEAAALCGRADLDVRILHMVRDPRATALSYQRAKDYIPALSPARSSAYWTAFNLASEEVAAAVRGRCLRLRHEDLCREPRKVMLQVLRFLDLGDEPPVDADGTVHLAGNHTVTGNPDRLRTGRTVIRPDERWRTGLPAAQLTAATAFAAPLLHRYGYPPTPRGR